MEDAFRTRGGRAGGMAIPLVLMIAPTLSLQAQELPEESYTATATLFSDLTHTEFDSDDDTRLGAGVSGNVGANLASGPHTFNARYGATLETEESSRNVGDDDNFSMRGASRYDFYEAGRRFDFNAGHSIRSVRNDTGFVLEDADYDTQNSVSAGAGINFYPGDLTTFRLSGQGGRTWEEGDRPDGESISADATLTRQVSEQSSVFLTGSRAWEDQDDLNDITLDSASVGMQSALHNGSFSLSAGVSRAESDDYENEAIIGSLHRLWSTSLTSTRFSYDRTQSSSILDLALAPIPDFGIEDEFSIRYQGVTVRDQLTLVHSTQRICDLCTVKGIVQAAKEEEVASSDDTWEYLVGAGVGFDVDDLKTLDFDYRWQGDAFDDKSDIDDEIHRFIVTYRHRLTELASWGTSFEAAMTRGVTDEERYQAKVFVTLGWDGMDPVW